MLHGYRAARVLFRPLSELAVESALAAGAVRFFTEDLRNGNAFDGLAVVNPFTLG